MRPFQIAKNSVLNRYPSVYYKSWLCMKDRKDLRILVFGCSTGEELFSLSALFPTATLIGLEINDEVLAIAQSRFEGFNTVRILRSSSEAIDDEGPYDLVFANSVFCLHPDRITASKIDPDQFYHFQQVVGTLLHALKPSGIFCIKNSNYDPIPILGAGFEAIDQEVAGFVPKFGVSGTKNVHVIVEAGVTYVFANPQLNQQDLDRQMRGCLFARPETNYRALIASAFEEMGHSVMARHFLTTSAIRATAGTAFDTWPLFEAGRLIRSSAGGLLLVEEVLVPFDEQATPMPPR